LKIEPLKAKVPTAFKVKPYTGEYFRGEIYKVDGSLCPPTTISILGAVIDIVTCKFLIYGDRAKDIRGQLMQEQLNIALVAALFLTISIPAMLWITELEQYGWSETERAIFGLSLCTSTANFAIAVVFAIFFSLSIQECVDDPELRRFTEQMGRYLQLSSVSFVVGVINIGGFSWTAWCYITFSWNWFLILFISCIGVNTFLFVFCGLVLMIKKLYAAKEGRHGTVVIHRSELAKAVKAHLARLESIDLASLENARCLLARNKVRWISGSCCFCIIADLRPRLVGCPGSSSSANASALSCRR
jgi:hypothetical protein